MPEAITVFVAAESQASLVERLAARKTETMVGGWVVIVTSSSSWGSNKRPQAVMIGLCRSSCWKKSESCPILPFHAVGQDDNPRADCAKRDGPDEVF